MKKTKTGGRNKGTPNKERKNLIELIEAKYPNYNPVLSMVDIANDNNNNLLLRFHANKEVAKYICPQLKAIEHTIEKEAVNDLRVINIIRATRPI